MSSIFPNAGREQANHVIVASRRSAGNSRRLERPILSGMCRQQPHRGSVQAMAAVNLSGVGTRRVTHPAHRHAFRNVLPARDPALVASGFHFAIRLTPCLWPRAHTECCEPQNENHPGKRPRIPRTQTPNSHHFIPWL